MAQPVKADEPVLRPPCDPLFDAMYNRLGHRGELLLRRFVLGQSDLAIMHQMGIDNRDYRRLRRAACFWVAERTADGAAKALTTDPLDLLARRITQISATEHAGYFRKDLTLISQFKREREKRRIRYADPLCAFVPPTGIYVLALTAKRRTH